MLTLLLTDDFIKKNLSDDRKKQVIPPIDKQVLLFHGMSERNVILLEEISSSQADTESGLGASWTDDAISQHLPCAPEEKVVIKRGEKSPGGVAE